MSQTHDLTKQLVSIPSWVGMGCDEAKIGQFIYDWLRKNTDLTVIKQPVKDGRFNVIAWDESPVKLLLAGHMDTVESRAGWTTDPFTPTLKNTRLYGLGATDMKGSLAAGLIALADTKNTKGVMFLAYCDEEYDFAGMRTFVKEYGPQLKPSLVVSLDGYADKIGTGCRGLIEVSFKLKGKTGHAGRPENGINAIFSGINCLSKLKRLLATKFSDPSLGLTTLNLAYTQGGLDLGTGLYGRQGNNIADLVEFVLDIRPASPLLTAAKLKSLLLPYLASSKLTLLDWNVRHDLGAWATKIEEIKQKINLPGNPETFGGYVDTQMIWGSCGKPTCLAIGAATPSLAHAPNESVELSDLETTRQNVTQIINNYLK